MKYKLIIFDMDGTILNTLEDLKNCLNYSLEKNGYPERTLEEVRQFVGNGIYKLIERATPDEIQKEETDKIFADFSEYYKEHCIDLTRPYDGIIDLIKELRHRGYMTAVVSNKLDFAVKDLVDKFFDGLFDISVGEREGILKKPAPDSVYLVLNELEVDKSNAIYIGDSEVDVATAMNAGIDSIIVEWGFRDREFLESEGAKVFAQKPADVLDILESK